MKMYPSEKKEKEGTSKATPTSQSSSESERRRERMETYKDARRRELSAKYGPQQDSTEKSFKTTRKKEDLRGGGPFLASYSSNQVPSTDARRHSRRDGNKTDSTNEEAGNGQESRWSQQEAGSASSKESVFVRETKASRLRAASRTPTSDGCSVVSRLSGDARKSEKDKTSSSGSPTWNSIIRRGIDKSHSRKSHLNRSHTSEGVYDDIYALGGSNTRRRRAKNLSLDSSPAKTVPEKFVSPVRIMGNSNGVLRDVQPDQSLRITRTPLSASKKSSPIPLDKLNGGLANGGTKKRAEDERKASRPGENSPGRKCSSDRLRQVDVAARAEILAASTLKMISRLDEINNKTKRTQGDSGKPHMAEGVLKKSLPCNSVISSNCRNNNNNNNNNNNTSNNNIINNSNNNNNFNCNNETSGGHKIDVKKVPCSDDNTAKGSVNRRNSRPKTDLKTVGQPPKKSIETKGKPEVAKPSILKNKSSSESQKPVSILKRKSFASDDGQSSSPPVTFSPSVLNRETSGKRTGILKKRRSLDESEVTRRRSYSPDGSYSDFKSILKNQRRFSMEELTRRSHSPVSAPQGILKRKSSKEEETEETSGVVEPQGILKRKQQPTIGHVKISDGVIMSAAAALGELQVSENVRPILKKKSSSEEHSASDLSLTEVPKSILKKKTSLESEEVEDKPKKPILKSSRTSEEPVEGKRSRGWTSGESDSVKPILKRENSRSRPAEEENGSDREVVLRRVKTKRQDRPYSSSDLDSELNAIFLKRRSLEFQPFSAMNFDLELNRTRTPSSNERLRLSSLRRPQSVAEKINNLENFLEIERMERERRNSPPGSPPGGKQFSSLPPERSLESQVPVASTTRTVPKLRSEDLFGGERQPIQPAFEAAFERSNSPDRCETTDEDTVGESASFVSLHRDLSLNAYDSDGDDLSLRSSATKFQKSNQAPDEDDVVDRVFSRTSFYSADSEVRLVEKHDSLLSVESCEEKISDLKLKESSSTFEDAMDAEELFQLRRSGSVTAKASLFREIENKSKEEEKNKSVKGTNSGIRRRQDKKLFESSTQRFHTQPVSSEEVELAVRKNRNNTEDKNDEENHEDELSTMSYKDRLRLFEATFSPQLPDPMPRKRGTRFKTQPVTTIEVETAQNQRAAAAAVAKEAAAAAAAAADRMQEPVTSVSNIRTTILDHGNVLRGKTEEEKRKRKGILKNSSQAEEGKERKSPGEEEEKAGEPEIERNRYLKKSEREVELRGILKQPSFEKKTEFSEEEEKKKGTKGRNGVLGANLAAILQKVEPVKVEFPRRREEKKEAPKYLRNEGIARVIKSRNSSSIVKSQSHSSVSTVFRPGSGSGNVGAEDPYGSDGEETRDREDVGETALRSGALRRSTTQPLAPSDGAPDDDMSGASIRERLARLKKSGELDWMKRKSHVTNLEDELSVITSGNYLFNENCLLRDKNRSTSPQNASSAEDSRNSSSILADRLGKLDAAKDGWKRRVKPSDAVRFSVEGKMMGKMDSLSPPKTGLQISPTRTPLSERKKRSPKATRFRSKHAVPSLGSVPSSPSEKPVNPIARSVSAPGSGKDGLFTLSASEDSSVVTVPKNDNETFTSFFHGISAEKTFQERLDIKDEDLDVVTQMKSSQLLVQKRNIKTQRRRAAASNPLKSLAARHDLQEYTEVKTVVAEKELRRIKIEKGAINSNLALEALAGLASREDFTAVNLKKASESGGASPDAPYKDLMLLQVKGRRHVQTRLVEPTATNVNAGDCFVLVTPNKVFHYVGEFANVIERSRGAEVASHVQQKGDLGCCATSVITIGEGGRATKEQIKEFWRLLGGDESCEREAGNVDEDELFESALVDTNMIYEVANDELVPIETFWGSIPKIEVLDPNKVLVFDFGSEFYVWTGKNVNLSKRKAALGVARELWEEGFDYEDCDLCPMTAASLAGARDGILSERTEKSGSVRPDWALFAKIAQNMETVLFREKFLDWPDYSRVIRQSRKEGGGDEGGDDADGSPLLEVKPCDAKEMIENVVPEPDLVLEGSHLGRGRSYFDEETRRCSEVTTKAVTVWRISEYEYSEVPSASVGQFHVEDSYVVRWHYLITITGRELGGQPSKHLTTGRDRYAYFCWQGCESPISDKGAAACLTVELDKEHGPQVRVVQGFEPPAFLSLFRGRMVVHRGRRSLEAPPASCRLFICRGASESESILFEVPCSMRQLRSAASFVLVDALRGHVIVWHGWKSLEHTRKIAVSAAKNIQADTPEEFDFQTSEVTLREEVEGSESKEFIRAVGGDNRHLYFCLLEDRSFCVNTPRLFHLSSVSGEFLFAEVASPYLSKEFATPYPFLQSDLYSASQPALFLLDSGTSLWLWQGWWDEDSETDRGTGFVRFQAERRAAMSTALSYWNLKHGSATSAPAAFLVWAGLEPLAFTNLFPFWTDRDDVAEINMKDGKKAGEAVAIRTELATLTQSTYPLTQLQNRPLPEGVNPTTLEDYLEPQCFPELFGIEKEEFFKMPSWKKKKLKQEAGLF